MESGLNVAANSEGSVDLAIVGAGPKGAAIAAKVHVLNGLGMSNLKLGVIERNELASSWTGRNGFTRGLKEGQDATATVSERKTLQ